MRQRNRKISMMLCILFLIFCFPLAVYCESIIYVDCDARGPEHDGTSWDRAFKTITEAVNVRTKNIWVRTGEYKENIVIKRSVNLFGGFLGGESSIDERIDGAFPSVINARLNGRGIEIGRMASAIIDGFTIRNGIAEVGGGILVNTNAVGHIRNCRIMNCEATSNLGGGGVYFAKYAGASDGSDWGEIRNSVISHNRALNGGGVVVEYHAYANLFDCVITNNHAKISGGGVHFPFHSGADVVNCTIAYNSADVSGGGAYIFYGGPHVISNSIIAFNSAPDGGGLFGDPPKRQLTLKYVNCNLYENSGGDIGGTVKPNSGSISSNPQFIAPELGEFRLKMGSPCKKMGAFPFKDLHEITRIEFISKLSNGDTVMLVGKVISKSDNEITYIKEIDGSSEIGIEGLGNSAPGDILASITGIIEDRESGKRILKALSHSFHTGYSYDLPADNK